MKKCIDFNTEKRKNAANSFEKKQTIYYNDDDIMVGHLFFG